MKNTREFFEQEKENSIEDLFLKIDLFLHETENKNEIIKELIKLYRSEKKNLEKNVREEIDEYHRIEIYKQIKKVKKIIQYLNKKIEEPKKEKIVAKKDKPNNQKTQIENKSKKKKDKPKISFSEETLTLVKNIENGLELDKCSIQEINDLIKYYRYEKEKKVNLKKMLQNKKEHNNLDFIYAEIRRYEKLLKQLINLRNKKIDNETPKEKEKKKYNINFRLPISMEQIKKLDRYCNINSVEIIESIQNINDKDINEKIEKIYNIYLECKDNITKKQVIIISNKRKLESKQKTTVEDTELINDMNNVLKEANSYINILNNLINYLKPYQRNRIKNDEIVEQDTISYKQQELVEHMELELDIPFNNVADVIEAYKIFIRNTDINDNWNYIIKLSNFIMQKLDSLNAKEKECYFNMINDCLKYKKLSIPKENQNEKNKLKELQEFWKEENEEKTLDFESLSGNYTEQIKYIINQAKVNKEEAHIIWLDCLEKLITKCTQEQLENIISSIAIAKEENKSELFQEHLTLFLTKYFYIFENYLDVYIMNMNIPKDKQRLLNNLKKIIENREISATNNNSYELLYKIIFKEKDISALKKLLSLDPKFINIKSYNNSYILENIFDLLINQIINDKYYYLENVFLIFIKYAGINMTQELFNNLITKIKDTKEKYKEQYNLDCILSNLHNKLDNIILLDTLKVEREEIYTHERQKTSYKNFLNLLNRNIITIDQKDTKYFENAISCDVLKDGHYQIGVYVSDVVDCLNEDLIIESNDLRHKEYKVPANRYNKHILKEGKVKFALAFTFITDEELNIYNFKVERARIRVKKNYTFEEVTQILDEGDCEDRQFYILQRMNNVARLMHKKRNPKNYLKKYMEFIPEIQREFTFFVNRYVAKDASLKELPLIYKNQLPKGSNNLSEILEEIQEPAKRIEKIMEIISSGKISSYSTINRGNDYFNGEEYTQITSPTRELTSLLNQILIINNYIDKEYINEEQKQDLEKTLMMVNHFNNQKK